MIKLSNKTILFQGIDIRHSMVEKCKRSKSVSQRNADSPPPVRRLRLRGDWSDTGINDTTITYKMFEKMTSIFICIPQDPMLDLNARQHVSIH